VSDPRQLRATVTVTPEMVAGWAEMSGDHNRLHVDPEFAAGTPYGRCIAHGPILASMVGELLAAHAGAPWTASARTSFRFVAPVFVPSTVTVVADVDVAAAGVRSARVACTDQDGVTVLTAVATWDESAR
jgi:3-hydroxybutyryl-CoA dehydratase